MSTMDHPTHLTGSLLPEESYRLLEYDDWIYLNTGDHVVVHQPGYPLQGATVDEVAEDAAYFWLWVQGVGRVLIWDGDASIYVPVGR